MCPDRHQQMGHLGGMPTAPLKWPIIMHTIMVSNLEHESLGVFLIIS